jgi:hypothetical protein
MNLPKSIISAAVILISQMCFSQTVEFGRVSVAELSEKEYLNDKDADAAVLYRYQDTYYLTYNGTSRLETKIQERIKIYNNDGFDYATEYINLYRGRSEKETVSKIRAFTYNLVDGKVEKSELDKDQIFESELSYNYDQVKFTMPNVREGSIVEFEYKISSPFIWSLDDFRFQRDIPVKKIEAQIRTPKGFNYKRTNKGYLYFHPKVSTKRDARVGMDMVIYSYHLSNVPALKDEPYVDNMSNYRAGVMFELLSIEIPGYANRNYSKSWGDVAKNIGSSSDYKSGLDKTKSFDDNIDAIIAKESDPLKRAKGLFKHVKETTEWNGVDGIYFQNGIKRTLKEKKGNAADINLLLVAMLRYAGIDANPIVLSTKDNAVPYFPTLERLNYVIAHAKIDDQSYYMDATDEFSDLNLMPIKDYNWGGLMIDNPNKVWSRVYSIAPSKSINRYSIKANLKEDGTVSGEYMSRLTNHKAYQFRKNVKDKDHSTRVSEREDSFYGIEIEDYELKNEDVYEGPVSEKFTYDTDEGIELIGDKIYFHPLLFLRMEENPFKQDKREFPVDFGYAYTNTYGIDITIPEGFTVESLPKPISMALPEELGKFKYVIRTSGSKIQLSVTFDINKAIIGAANYDALKEYFNQVIIKEAEQIVVAKND